jgi:hypothetical protein
MGDFNQAKFHVSNLHIYMDKIVHSDNSDHQKTLQNIYLVAYIVSGIAYKFADGKKALRFFLNGLKWIGYNIQ